MPTRKPVVPPIIFDGRLWWYSQWYDPDDDRCCLCRGAISDDEVPLILFRKIDAHETWQARIHWRPCAESLFACGFLNTK
jgi:hypothetical protein